MVTWLVMATSVAGVRGDRRGDHSCRVRMVLRMPGTQEGRHRLLEVTARGRLASGNTKVPWTQFGRPSGAYKIL